MKNKLVPFDELGFRIFLLDPASFSLTDINKFI
jgi:hypothetical protein